MLASARRPRWTTRRTGRSAWSTSPVSRCASARQAERRVAPDAPRRLLRDGEARVGHRLLGTGGTHDRSQHRPRRVERRRAVGRHQVERSGVDDRRPPLRFGGLPGQHRDPAGQHGERGILLDCGVAERREPALHRRHLAGLVGRQDQRRHQLDASVPLGRVQQVLDRHRRRSVGLVPVGGPQVQLHDDVGLDPTQLTEQELTEQGVVAVPLPPTVERDQEHVRGLEAAQLGPARLMLRGGRRRAERTVDRAPPCAAGTAGALGQSNERLAVQVVGHVPVVAGDRQRLAVAVARDHRREVEADRPAFGPFGHSGGQLRGEADVCLREDLLGAGRVEGQVARQELQRVTRSPQPRQVRLLGTTRRDQLGASRNPRDHHAQHIVTGRRLQFVEVVQHEHERNRARPRSAEARRGAARPNTDTPRPPMSATRSALPGETRAYADASKVSRAAGSSSKRSRDTQATRRSSARAH